MCSLYQGLKFYCNVEVSLDFKTENMDTALERIGGFYLNSLFSSSIKSDPTVSLFMPKFSFRPGRNKQNPDGISDYSATLSAVVNNILLYTCLDLCASASHLSKLL